MSCDHKMWKKTDRGARVCLSCDEVLPQWGGARANSGRKKQFPDGTKRVVVDLSPEDFARLERCAGEMQINRSDAIRRLINVFII